MTLFLEILRSSMSLPNVTDHQRFFFPLIHLNPIWSPVFIHLCTSISLSRDSRNGSLSSLFPRSRTNLRSSFSSASSLLINGADERSNTPSMGVSDAIALHFRVRDKRSTGSSSCVRSKCRLSGGNWDEMASSSSNLSSRERERGVSS